MLRTLASGLKHQLKLRKWAHNADPRRFDWDWKAAQHNRAALVNLLLAQRSSPAYLEIGCRANALFDAVPAPGKIGVDPVSGGTHRMTADAFFKTNTAEFDVVFIEGNLHRQVRADVISALGCLKPDCWVCIRNMLPSSWLEQHVPKLQANWTGDVWKLGFELAQTTGIGFKIVAIDYGVGVLRKPKTDLALKDLSAALKDETFSYLYDHFAALPVIGWEAAQPWLLSG